MFIRRGFILRGDGGSDHSPQQRNPLHMCLCTNFFPQEGPACGTAGGEGSRDGEGTWGRGGAEPDQSGKGGSIWMIAWAHRGRTQVDPSPRRSTNTYTHTPLRWVQALLFKGRKSARQQSWDTNMWFAAIQPKARIRMGN